LARAQAGGGLDWVAAGSAWQAERMTISLSSVGAERIPAWLERWSADAGDFECVRVDQHEHPPEGVV
jgi:hypothetical protein